MPEITLNELPDWSPWPARLLGLDAWNVPDRTIETVEHEYDQDKYAACRSFWQDTAGQVTAEEVKAFEFGGEATSLFCVSDGDRLIVTERDEARARYYALVTTTMSQAIREADVVVELGSGYGYNLWMLSQQFSGTRFLGGEYSANAVGLAKELYSGHDEIEVRPFNFYDREYRVLDAPSKGERAVVFTAHAVEQLPSSRCLLAGLRPWARAISNVFHFEPLTELHGETLLGLMRRRYAVLNDYNRDLFSTLRSDADVQILEVRANVFGLQPFNPTSVIQWRFSA